MELLDCLFFLIVCKQSELLVRVSLQMLGRRVRVCLGFGSSVNIGRDEIRFGRWLGFAKLFVSFDVDVNGSFSKLAVAVVWLTMSKC